MPVPAEGESSPTPSASVVCSPVAGSTDSSLPRPPAAGRPSESTFEDPGQSTPRSISVTRPSRDPTPGRRLRTARSPPAPPAPTAAPTRWSTRRGSRRRAVLMGMTRAVSHPRWSPRSGRPATMSIHPTTISTGDPSRGGSEAAPRWWRQRPMPDRAVASIGNQRVAVGREGHPLDPRRVAAQNHRVSHAIDGPQVHPVELGRGHPPAVG